MEKNHNPQLEDGHTRIANELLEALSKVKMSGQEWQVLMAILRKTYGFQKKKDNISLSQLVRLTGLERSRVCEAVKALENKAITSTEKRTGGTANRGFNKDYGKWELVRKNVHSTEKRTGTSTEKRNLLVRKNVHTKETITKETIKEIYICEFDEFTDWYERESGRKIKSRKPRLLKFRARRRVFSKEEIMAAAKNIMADKFLQGDNDQGKIYGDIDYMLRNDQMIEKYSNQKAKCSTQQSSPPSALSVRL